MQFVLRWFQKALSGHKGRTFAARVQYSGINQIGQDCVQVVLIMVAVTNFSAYTVQSQLVIDGLQEQIAALKFTFLPVRNFAVWMKHNRKAEAFFRMFILFGFNTCLFLCPIHNIIPSRAVFCQKLI